MSRDFCSYIRKFRHLRCFGISASAIIAVLMTSAVFPIVKHTDTAEASPGTASTTTLTMTQGSGSASVDLAVQDASGTFATSSDSQMAKFNITTNNYTGYTLTISSDNDSGILSNGSGGNLSSIDSILGTSDFDTTTYNNKWGYKPSKYNGVPNTAYFPAPTTTATVLDKTSSANSTATADNTYSIGLGARADYSMPSGTYTATFILTATANPVPYSISFTDNSGDTIAGMPKTLIGDVDNTQVELPTNIPQRTGFTFAGWCDTTPTVGSDGSSTCPTGGTTYQPSTDSTSTYIGIDQTAAMNATTLYAMWTAIPVTPTVDLAVTLEDGISAVSFIAADHPGRVTTTSREIVSLEVGVTYTMTAYLTDGYIFSGWEKRYTSGVGTDFIIGSSTTNPTTLEFGETFFGDPSIIVHTVHCVNISGTMQTFSPTSNTCTSGVLTDSRDNNSYTVAKIHNLWWMSQNLRFTGTSFNSTDTNVNTSKNITYYSLDSNDSSYSERCDTSNGYNNSCTKDSNDTTTGVWYNYAAATAMTITGNNSQAKAQYSICPKGWRLPTENEYQDIKLNNYAVRSPFVPVTGGIYNDGSISLPTYGYWWTSTSENATSRSSGIYYAISLGVSSLKRTYGLYVRCVMSS